MCLTSENVDHSVSPSSAIVNEPRAGPGGSLATTGFPPQLLHKVKQTIRTDRTDRHTRGCASTAVDRPVSREEGPPHREGLGLSLIHISEPTRLGMISYAVFCLKKKK